MTGRTTGPALRTLLIIAIIIFVSETVVMLVLARLADMPLWYGAVLDSIMLVCLIAPFLYLFLFRPMERQIEERHLAEAALKKEKDRAQRYLDVAGVVMLILDAEGRVVLINRKGLEILGQAEADVLGSQWFDNFVAAEARGQARAAFEAATRDNGRGFESFEHPVVTAGGKERLIAWNNTIVRDEDRRVSAVISSGEDVTEARRGEEALRAAHAELELRVRERTRELSEAKDRLEREFAEHRLLDQTLKETELRFRSVAQSVNDAIVGADSRGFINFWNRGATRIFGYDEDEIIGKPLVLIMPERFRADHIKGLERVSRIGRSDLVGKTLELYGLRKDGSEFPLELSIGTWTTARGTFYSGVLRDSTARKRMEEEKESIQAQLVHSQKLEAIGRLIVGVAHDFSNIILSIKGYTKVTMRTLGEDNPLYKNLNQIQQLVDRGSNITRQLLLFGRKQPVRFAVIDMNETIDGILKLINHLIGNEITVKHDLCPDLWTVRGDKGNLEQVLMNLVVNANDAMPHGGTLTISTENLRVTERDAETITEARPGRYVCVKVRDTGVGMDKTVSDRIFDPFFTTKGKDGSGLGLSVVYGVISRHGGWIDVESAPGEGSVFRFCLPTMAPGRREYDPKG